MDCLWHDMCRFLSIERVSLESHSIFCLSHEEDTSLTSSSCLYWFICFGLYWTLTLKKPSRWTSELPVVTMHQRLDSTSDRASGRSLSLLALLWLNNGFPALIKPFSARPSVSQRPVWVATKLERRTRRPQPTPIDPAVLQTDENNQSMEGSAWNCSSSVRELLPFAEDIYCMFSMLPILQRTLVTFFLFSQILFKLLLREKEWSSASPGNFWRKIKRP